MSQEIALRHARLARLAEAQAVLEARAKDRDAVEQADYEAKMQAREAKAQRRDARPVAARPRPQPQDPAPRTSLPSRTPRRAS